MKNIGSKWWKFDFHTHTPQSYDYGRGDQNTKNIQPQDWLQKAMESGLDCVVVTDHNSGGWIDLLKEENKKLQALDIKPEWYNELTIFPGVEISVANSNGRVHLLAVFDPSCNGDKISGVLGSCGITDGFGDDKTTATTKSFLETVQKIKDANGIAIPAHIDRPKGLLSDISSLTPELKNSLEAVSAAEFCDLHKFDVADVSLKKAVERLAKVAGSDAHKPNDIGKHSSWIKMSSPSIEGLNLALMDHEFCVKNQESNPNHNPDFFISELEISSMQHCGRIQDKPLNIQLNPHFNVIIGGRGTGKSTVLESIRIVSHRDKELEIEAPKLKSELDRFMSLSSNKGVMLDNTQILLNLHRRGKNYSLCWRQDEKVSNLKEKINEEWSDAEPGDIKERFPISIFSQKQINELATNPRGLLDIVDRTPDVNKYEWNLRWESIKSDFLQLREKKRNLLRQLSEEQTFRTKLGDINNDLKQYEEQGHGEILKQYQQRSQQKEFLEGIHKVFDEFSEKIQTVESSTEFVNFPDEIFDIKDETATEINTIYENASRALKKCKETLHELIDKVVEIKEKQNVDIRDSKWQCAFNDSISQYDSLLKNYEGKESQPSFSLYESWIQQKSKLQEKIKQFDKLKKEKDDTEKEIKEKLEQLEKMRLELFDKRQEFIGKVIGESDFVRMELVKFGDIISLEKDYRDILGLEADKFRSSVLDRDEEQGILWNLYNREASNLNKDDIGAKILELKTRTINIALGDDTGEHKVFNTLLKKDYEKQPTIFDQLEIWWPEDNLKIQYSKKPTSGKFEDIEKGSAGQKAAAILAFLLSYGDDPLIIDQPEDDLDNALIYELIVKQIHENKNRRQLLIVTHNPNIVVNGDAELVHVLKYINGQVQLDIQGGLEEIQIREAICTLMEGGRQAFDKRYKRITLGLSQ